MAGRRAFRCAQCGAVHEWAQDDAIVEEGFAPPALRALEAAAGAGR